MWTDTEGAQAIVFSTVFSRVQDEALNILASIA